MKLSTDQQEKLTLAIQVVLSTIVVALRIKNIVKVQTARIKKLSGSDVRQPKNYSRTQRK
ncbi:MAG: hypothetical protein Q4B57_05070 [Eubacteriales bacterium]|nr:hypothetical protein [Eubacteriales bacterium]